MKGFILLMTILWVRHAPVHDVPIAFYNIKVNEDVVSLEIQFDKEDTEFVVSDFFNTDFNNELLSEYFKEHSIWYLNNQEHELEICSFGSDREHYYIKGEFSSFFDELKMMEIINTCLVDKIQNHSNVIQIEYGENFRGFRMTRKRKKIEIVL